MKDFDEAKMLDAEGAQNFISLQQLNEWTEQFSIQPHPTHLSIWYDLALYIGWSCIPNCFLLSSLPCFYAFCWSAIPTSHQMFNLFYSCICLFVHVYHSGMQEVRTSFSAWAYLWSLQHQDMNCYLAISSAFIVKNDYGFWDCMMKYLPGCEYINTTIRFEYYQLAMRAKIDKLPKWFILLAGQY